MLTKLFFCFSVFSSFYFSQKSHRNIFPFNSYEIYLIQSVIITWNLFFSFKKLLPTERSITIPENYHNADNLIVSSPKWAYHWTLDPLPIDNFLVYCYMDQCSMFPSYARVLHLILVFQSFQSYINFVRQ